MLSLRERAEMRLRIRCNASGDELRGSHGCQVFNNSRREAILRFTPNSTNTRRPAITTRDPPRRNPSLPSSVSLVPELQSAAVQKSAPTLASVTARAGSPAAFSRLPQSSASTRGGLEPINEKQTLGARTKEWDAVARDPGIHRQ